MHQLSVMNRALQSSSLFRKVEVRRMFQKSIAMGDMVGNIDIDTLFLQE